MVLSSQAHHPNSPFSGHFSQGMLPSQMSHLLVILLHLPQNILRRPDTRYVLTPTPGRAQRRYTQQAGHICGRSWGVSDVDTQQRSMLPTRPAMVISASPYYHIWVQAYKPFELLSHGGFGDRELVLSQKVGESEKGRAGRDSRFNHSVFCSRRASKTCCPVKVVPHVGQAQVLVFNSAFTSVVCSTVRPIAAFSAAGSGRGLPTLLLKVQVRML